MPSAAVVGDDPLRVDAIAGALAPLFDHVARCVVGRAATAAEADVVIVDVDAPVANGWWDHLAVTDDARVILLHEGGSVAWQPDRPVEVFDVMGSVDALRAALDPDAAPLPEPRQLVDTGARSVLDALTPREREVLAELATGDDNRAIGERLGISEHTVRTHVQNILPKLQASSRADAALVAMSLGLGEDAQGGR